MVEAIADALEEALRSILSDRSFTKYQTLVSHSIEKSTRKDSAEYKISLTTKLFWAIFKDQRSSRCSLSGGHNGTDKKKGIDSEPSISITSNLGLERPCVTQSKLNEIFFLNLPVDKLQNVFSYVGIGHENSSLTLYFTTL